MKNIINFENNKLTISSLEVAEMLGKNINIF